MLDGFRRNHCGNPTNRDDIAYAKLQAVLQPIIRLSLIFSEFHNLRLTTGNSCVQINLHSLMFNIIACISISSCICLSLSLLCNHLLTPVLPSFDLLNVPFLLLMSAASIFCPPSFQHCLYEDDSTFPFTCSLTLQTSILRCACDSCICLSACVCGWVYGHP